MPKENDVTVPTVSNKYVVSPAEIQSLISYAAHRGIDPNNTTLDPLIKALRAYEAGPNPALESELIQAYKDLAKVTYEKDQVNGKTIGDTKKAKTRVNRLFKWGLFLLAVVSATEILNLWRADDVHQDCQEWWLESFDFFHLYVLTYLSPFFWGALGSMVYIWKRMTDEIRNFRFDSDRVEGQALRVGLGAILGGIIVSIYDPTAFKHAGVSLDVNGVAFLSGIGVKVIYGVLEKSVETLGEKLNLKTLQQPKTKKPNG